MTETASVIAPARGWSLAESHSHCARSCCRAASNFYLTFWLLPKPKRQATCALYAFLRRTDDLGDGDAPLAARLAALGRWKASLTAALDGDCDNPVWPALVDAVREYGIPRDYLFAAIRGVEMDLYERSYETAAELEDYCHHVASVVGLACIHIWGFHGDAALEPARQCGFAFQWTNILRDLAEDASRGRVYLPAESLRRHGYTPDDLVSGVADDRLARLIDEHIARAKLYYDRAAKLEPLLSPDGRRVFRAMYGTYRELLRRIERTGVGVLRRRVRVPRWRKLEILARAMFPRPTRSNRKIVAS